MVFSGRFLHFDPRQASMATVDIHFSERVPDIVVFSFYASASILAALVSGFHCIYIFLIPETMERFFLPFYRNFYLRTGGFLPCKPLSRSVYPGDFFQVKNGEMLLLGNIFRNGLINPEDCTLKYGIPLDPAAWWLSGGMVKRHASSGTDLPLGDATYNSQILAFAGKGSFGFKGHQPQATRIMNWSDLEQPLIIKLTQTVYTFRELYVVTETAAASDWVLAIAASKKAELEMISEAGGAMPEDFFDHPSAKAIRMKEMAFYHHEKHRKPVFFKAKKLTVQDERTEVFISNLLYRQMDHSDWISSFYGPEMYHDTQAPLPVTGHPKAGVLDMLQAGELNPNTALRYFKWADASLDDIEKLFISYGCEP